MRGAGVYGGPMAKNAVISGGGEFFASAGALARTREPLIRYAWRWSNGGRVDVERGIFFGDALRRMLCRDDWVRTEFRGGEFWCWMEM